MALPLGISLVTSSDAVHLSAWMDSATRARVLKGLSGLGMPPVDVQWAEGAGDGARYKGTRVLPRDIRLPLTILGSDRAEVATQYNRLAKMLAPGSTSKLRASEPSGAVWETSIVRVGGGDYEWGAGTNGRSVIITEVNLRAGDPYWTSTALASRTLTAGDTGRGLIPDLAELAITATSATGSATLENTGSAPALPTWVVSGPCTRFAATSPSGEVIEWTAAADPEGALAEGETLTLNTSTGTVVDGTGANRFGGMSTAPRFWRLPAGESTVTVEIEGTTAASSVFVSWRPRSWVVF